MRTTGTDASDKLSSLLIFFGYVLGVVIASWGQFSFDYDITALYITGSILMFLASCSMLGNIFVPAECMAIGFAVEGFVNGRVSAGDSIFRASFLLFFPILFLSARYAYLVSEELNKSCTSFRLRQRKIMAALTVILSGGVYLLLR